MFLMVAKNTVAVVLFTATVTPLYLLISPVLLGSNDSDLPNVTTLSTHDIVNGMSDNAIL